MARALSTAQRTAIRRIHDGEWEHVNASTLRVLIREHLVQDDGMSLTGRGELAYERIMESGDGPEDLKARLNVAFGGRSRW